MTMPPRMLLLLVPLSWTDLWTGHLARMAPSLMIRVHGADEYAPEAVDYALGFRPRTGLLATLPNLKAVFSLGAGVDGFLRDPDYPRHVPLVRFVDDSLSAEMVQYVLLHTLMHHRQSALLAQFQSQHKWHQTMPPRATKNTRTGILGLGEIGTKAAEQLRELGFDVAGWSRSRKTITGIQSFAGDGELPSFLARSDILICLLPLTPDTNGILNARTFAQLPKGAYVINAARGGHLIETDLLAALDNGHLSGAALDVFETEPLPSDSPLWSHPNIIVTPHVGGISDPELASRFVVDGIMRIESGLKPENIVDLTRGY